jgi:nucleoside-diphosphate-sugar epimerase
MISADRHAVVVGQSGFMGRAMARAVAAQGGPAALTSLPHREFVREVLEGRGKCAVADVLALGRKQDWIVATGIVDPRADPILLRRINVDFPCILGQLLEAAAPNTSRLITIGSVMEGRDGLVATNAYLASKSQMASALAQVRTPAQWLHFRLHTLYGGHKIPHPCMFAGQMFTAISTGAEFKMSGGMQFREYHHVDDIASSIISAASQMVEGPIVVLSSGNPVRLKDLAQAVFAHFGVLDRLVLGAVAHAGGEVFENVYEPSAFVGASRDPIQNLIAWFESLGLRRP